jgi:hypothetical protein
MVGSSAGNFLQLAYARSLWLFFEILPSVRTQRASVFSPTMCFPALSQVALLRFSSSRTCHIRPGDVFAQSVCVHVWFDGFPLDVSIGFTCAHCFIRVHGIDKGGGFVFFLVRSFGIDEC